MVEAVIKGSDSCVDESLVSWVETVRDESALIASSSTGSSIDGGSYSILKLN